ncbi:MAG: AsmA family protein [Gemmobacter sp.]
MRWIVGVVSAVVLVALVVLGLIALVPTERIAGLAAAEFGRMTGRTLTIGGSVRASVWPVLGVRMEGVALANAGWSAEGPMLTAREMDLSVEMAALFGGEVRITGLRAEGLTLILERAEDGVGNWSFDSAGSEAEGAAPAAVTPFTLDRADIADGRVIFIDHGTGQRTEVAGIAAEMAVPVFDGPVTLTGEAMLGDQAVALTATADNFAAAMAGRVVEADLALEAGGSSVDFKGRLGIAPPAAEGTVTADLSDLRALAALAGSAVPDLPEGLGRSTRTLSGQLTLAPEGTLHLRQGAVTLDGNSMTVAADVAFDGPRPRVSAQIDAGALVVPGLAATNGGAGASPQDAGWPRDAIDVSALGLVDAEVALRADSLTLGPAQLGRTRLLLTIDRARAVIEAREVQVYGGRVGGQFVVNGRGGLSVGGDLTLAGMQMQAVLADLAGYDRLTTTGDLQVRFLGVGNSVAAIMATLEGEGRLALGRGELGGFDLLGMLRTLEPGYVGEGQKTIFDGVSGSFTMTGGVLANDDLALTAPFFAATGRGTVGLGAQVLDYRIAPTALTLADGTGGVRVPLQITGPWSAPRFTLDLKALADQELADEREKLEAAAKEAEARAKAELEAKAAEELGIVRQEGESIEDAARRRAEEALEDETQRVLQNLLGD